jgi:TadE-like protein
MFHSSWKTLNSKKAEDSGQTYLEFALAAMVFVLLIFATLDFGYLFYARVTLQNAVRQAARYAITGNCGPGGSEGSNCFVNGPGDRLNVIMQTVTTYSFNLQPTVTVSCVGTCPGWSGGTGTNNAGGPGDTVKITAQYTFTPIITGRLYPGGHYTFNVSATFKNESFQPPPPS